MIGTIRRHQQWLWVVIIAATIISFTTYLSPTNRNKLGGALLHSEGDYGSINGEPVTRDQFFSAEREGRLFFRLRSGEWPDNEEQKKQVDAYALQSLLLDAEMDEYKINVTTEAAARFTKQLLGIPPDQAMPQEKFQEFIVNELGRKGGLTLDDFDRFARHQCGQEYLSEIVGMPGKLITPKEAEFFYRRENEPMATEWVNFTATNFYGFTAPTDAELTDFFSKHQADYRLPDRIQVNYVEFDSSNYFAQADKLLGTNLDDRAEQYYHQQGPDAFRDEAGVALAPDAAIARIKKQLRQFAALTEARKDANALLATLSEGHDDQHPFSPDDLAALAKTKSMTVKTTAPFDEKTGSKDLDAAPNKLHVLFSLRENDPDDKARSLLYAPSPLLGESGVYVVGLQQRLPSQVQALSVVYDKAVADYRRDKARELARAAGEKFDAALQAGMVQQDKTFDAVCSSENLKPVPLPEFSLTSTNVPPPFSNKALFERVQETAFALPNDQCSKFVPTDDGGFVLYVKERLPLDEAKMQAELPAYLARMREQRQVAAFQAWMQRQMQLHLVPPANLRGKPVS
jgi:hypothetical protein